MAQPDPEPQSPHRAEVESLNGDLLRFDLDTVEIEELERRFEMALAMPAASPDLDCNCPNLRSCGTYCVPPPL